MRRALSSLGAQATASDPWLALTCAITQLETGEVPAARAHLRHAQIHWPSHNTADLGDLGDLAALQAAAEQLATTTQDAPPTHAATDISTATDISMATDLDALSAEPSLEASPA